MCHQRHAWAAACAVLAVLTAFAPQHCDAACSLDIVNALQFSNANGTYVAAELNFTSNPAIPTPWNFTLNAPFRDLTSWHWSIQSESADTADGVVSGYWQVIIFQTRTS